MKLLMNLMMFVKQWVIQTFLIHMPVNKDLDKKKLKHKNLYQWIIL